VVEPEIFRRTQTMSSVAFNIIAAVTMKKKYYQHPAIVKTVSFDEGVLQAEAPIFGYVVNNYDSFLSKPSRSASSNY